MSISLSLISGKGGSGKTTIALALSQILAACGNKVLLVDCDMNTHGATYFFESFLIDKKNIITTAELFQIEKRNYTKKILSVANNIDFVPSSVYFPYKPNFDYSVFIKRPVEFDNYDVILFDCQAGYSLFTNVITENSDKNLVVLEADAISSSALRVLHAQLSDQLNKGNTFQVFNKITKEECEVYSKVTHGTFFTNLNPVLFDWSVRKAFATSELPEIDENNPMLTDSIYELAFSLFPQFRKHLQNYIISVKSVLIENLNIKIKNQKKLKRAELIFRNINLLVTLLATMLLFTIGAIIIFDLNVKSSMITIMTFALVSANLVFTLVITRRSQKKDFSDLTDKSNELQKEMEILHKRQTIDKT